MLGVLTVYMIIMFLSNLKYLSCSKAKTIFSYIVPSLKAISKFITELSIF
ncbi:hypothetical protein Q2T41_19490 [Maribacter confluentis]|uniref:Uncharacterized protein n=1 Tax=Maribacter confluentis TaxID=1656093 RepID=A0ABT8RU05_9FLAO|nr:hypothetical protein [Maribacter confluentis]MDO1514421.1 hypothetical protein [Maribacter confluentis]MDO1514825.1 hypothetical protein [Maribacter confluentis]